MNAFDLMKHIGFKGGVLPPPVPPETTFISAKSSVSFGFIAPAGKVLHVDWGDGTSEDVTMTGSLITKSKNYGTSATRTITLSGDGNPALTHLELYGNLSTSINVSANTALTYLDVAQNREPSIDVSKNTLLTHLEVYNNLFITALDISANPDITYLDIGPCAIPSAGINTILARLVAGGKTNGTIYAGQTPSAPPTGQGLTDKATLISRGWAAYTN